MKWGAPAFVVLIKAMDIFLSDQWMFEGTRQKGIKQVVESEMDEPNPTCGHKKNSERCKEKTDDFPIRSQKPS